MTSRFEEPSDELKFESIEIDVPGIGPVKIERKNEDGKTFYLLTPPGPISMRKLESLRDSASIRASSANDAMKILSGEPGYVEIDDFELKRKQRKEAEGKE